MAKRKRSPKIIRSAFQLGVGLAVLDGLSRVNRRG